MKTETNEELAQKLIKFFSKGNTIQSWQCIQTYMSSLEQRIIYDNFEHDLHIFFGKYPSLESIQFSIREISGDFYLNTLDLTSASKLGGADHAITFLFNSYHDVLEHLYNRNIKDIHRSNIKAAFESVLQGRAKEVYNAVQYFEKNKLEKTLAHKETHKPHKI